MIRDFEPDDRAADERLPRTGRSKAAQPEPSLSREARPIQERGYRYEISPDQLQTLRDIGRFRTVALADLVQYRYAARADSFRADLRALTDQGLLQKRIGWVGTDRKLPVAVLTKRGQAIVQRLSTETGQRYHAGFVKPGEVAHDAAIYR